MALVQDTLAKHNSPKMPNIADVCEGTVRKVCDRTYPWEIIEESKKGNKKSGEK